MAALHIVMVVVDHLPIKILLFVKYMAIKIISSYSAEGVLIPHSQIHYPLMANVILSLLIQLRRI